MNKNGPRQLFHKELIHQTLQDVAIQIVLYKKIIESGAHVLFID